MPDQITVSGWSSGGSIAQILQVAYSKLILACGVFSHSKKNPHILEVNVPGVQDSKYLYALEVNASGIQDRKYLYISDFNTSGIQDEIKGDFHA